MWSILHMTVTSLVAVVAPLQAKSLNKKWKKNFFFWKGLST